MKRSLIATVLALLPLAACSEPKVEVRMVTVDDQGYHPDVVYAPPGKVTPITFKRTTEYGCGDELVFPTLNIKKALPLNTPVIVDVTMPAKGEIAFTCGMAMYKGKVVVR